MAVKFVPWTEAREGWVFIPGVGRLQVKRHEGAWALRNVHGEYLKPRWDPEGMVSFLNRGAATVCDAPRYFDGEPRGGE